MSRLTYSAEDRRATLKAFRASGLSQRAFCSGRDINVNTLQYFMRLERNRRAIQRPPRGQRARFVEVRSAQDVPRHTQAPVEVRLEGIELRMAKLPPAPWIAEVVRALA